MYKHMIHYFFSSKSRHTRSLRDWSSDVCSSDLVAAARRLHDGAAAVVVDERLQLVGVRDGRPVGLRHPELLQTCAHQQLVLREDRKSVVEGKSVHSGCSPSFSYHCSYRSHLWCS